MWNILNLKKNLVFTALISGVNDQFQIYNQNIILHCNFGIKKDQLLHMYIPHTIIHKRISTQTPKCRIEGSYTLHK